jgi:guanylate kinase
MTRGVSSYDYIIINDDLEVAFQELKAIITSERIRRGRVDIDRLKL